MKTRSLALPGILSILVIATIPILFAAVQSYVWNFYYFIIIAAFLTLMWQKKAGSDHDLIVRTHPSVIVFFVWAVIMCFPLPDGIISVISPKRFETLKSALNLTGLEQTWFSISYSSKKSFAWTVFLSSLWLFYSILRYYCTDRKFLLKILFVMAGIGTLEALYGLIQALVPSIGVLWVDYVNDYMGNARGTFINRNHFAGFIEMIWPLVLGYTLSLNGHGPAFKSALSTDRLNRQALMALSIVLLLLSLVLSRSRAGITGGAIGLLTFWFLAHPRIKSIALQSRVLLGGMALVLCIYCFTIGIGPIFERFLSVEDGYSRINIWRDSLLILKNHPFGIGLHNYETVFQVYNRSYHGDKIILYAHNDFLQLLVETGWIGFLILIGGFAQFIRQNLKSIKRLDVDNDPTRFFIAVGAFSGIISLTFHCLFDFNLQIPANCLYFVTLMAILSSCNENEHSFRRFASA